MTRSYWQRREQGSTIHCDVAVVGGGIIGSSTAYWLKRAGVKHVALIEAHQVGYGASGRNAGFLLQGAAVDYVTDIHKYGKAKAEALWAFTKENRALIEAELNPQKIALEGGGSLIFAGSSGENQRLLDSAALLQQLGEPVTHWDAERITQKTRGC